jgi:formiminotetrahydrofolate cyclodeaminase
MTTMLGLEGRLIADLVRDVADSADAPGGGVVAGLTLAFAAALVVKAARAAGDGWAEAGGTAAQATVLGRRGLAAGRMSGEAYGEATALMRTATGTGERDDELAGVLERSAQAPLDMTAIAADLAVLAADTAEHGGIAMRPEAVTACVLAEACCVAAAHLVEINLGLLGSDARLAQIAAHVSDARAARARVTTALAS